MKRRLTSTISFSKYAFLFGAAALGSTSWAISAPASGQAFVSRVTTANSSRTNLHQPFPDAGLGGWQPGVGALLPSDPAGRPPVPQAIEVPSDGEDNGIFGQAVTVSGNIGLVGANGATVGGNTDLG